MQWVGNEVRLFAWIKTSLFVLFIRHSVLFDYKAENLLNYIVVFFYCGVPKTHIA